MAWYSGASGPTLQRLASEEVVRGLTGPAALEPGRLMPGDSSAASESGS